MKPRASRLTGMAGRSARAEMSRREVAALAEESRATKYPADAEFAPEAPRDRGGGSRGSKHLKAVREMSARSMSQLAIATELGIAPSAVGALMRRHKIKKGLPAAEGEG